MNRPTFRTIARLVAPWRTIRLCPTHGQQPPNAWGCPECVQELRAELVKEVLGYQWWDSSRYDSSPGPRITLSTPPLDP